METAASLLIDSPGVAKARQSSSAFALVFGMVLTLAVSGYQFGRGNHTVYLLDGLRAVHPELLRNDWFVTQTLQYHACFSLVTQTLMRLHLLEPGFLIGYLALIVIWHIVWRKLVIELGGSDPIYLLSVFLFYVSAAGISIGVFQFLQDGCFLPSNVASVAMLAGMVSWVGGRRMASGIWLGVAGIFHVNYAVVAIGLWLSLTAWEMLDQFPDLRINRWMPRLISRDAWTRRAKIPRATAWGASALVLLPSLLNIGLALPDDLRHGGTMPMREFVSVYVRFRHTHHFDPLHWPAILWLSFLWPIPLAIWAGSNWNPSSPVAVARKDACRIFSLIFVLQIIALLFAGVWFINEPLVQLCFWRFSIYIKLMSCVGAAFVFCDERVMRHATLSRAVWLITILAAVVYAIFAFSDPAGRGTVWRLAYDHRQGIGLVIALWAIFAINLSLNGGIRFHRLAIFLLPLLPIVAWPHLGVGMTPEPDDAEYREVCLWARDPAVTPVDAIFLVPPQETDFRLYAQRAIVVNFKHVPQLSGEIVQWQSRLLDVLGVPDVGGFPRGYTQTLRAIESLYEHRPAADLFAVARKYGARYIVVDHSLGGRFDAAIVFHRETNRYLVYDLNLIQL